MKQQNILILHPGHCDRREIMTVIRLNITKTKHKSDIIFDIKLKLKLKIFTIQYDTRVLVRRISF